MSVKISVAIITKNEERNIGRCLESVSEVADEIVVVDSYSTDKTRQICESFDKVRFVENPFEGHIEQKNFAASQASHHYILSLDADEALDDELRKSVLTAKNNWTHDAHTMNRLTNYCGNWIRHTGWYPDRKLRLFDRRKGRWGGRNPHDLVFMDKDATYKHLKGDLLHYSFYTISEHVAQMNFFTDIMAQDAFKKGKKAGILRIFISPLFKFFKKYIVQQGFRDGYYGLVISSLTVFYTFMKYLKLREMHKEAARAKPKD